MPMVEDTLNDNEVAPDVNGEDDDAQDEFKKSTLNLAGLLGPTHPGRPANEEPHVKKTMKNKKEKIELICKVDQDELGFDEDEFDDLKALFTVRSYNIEKNNIWRKRSCSNIHILPLRLGCLFAKP